MPVRSLLLLSSLLGAAPLTAGAQAMPVSGATAAGTNWSGGLDASVQLVVESDTFWGLQRAFAAGAAYDDTPQWGEVWVKPWIAFERPMTGWQAYGRASALATATVGTDVFGAGDTGRLAVEEIYLGAKGEHGRVGWDISAGSRNFRLGEGLLISLGGGNGFERGALRMAPHTAWRRAVLASARRGAIEARVFHLDPDELASADSHTRLHGAALEWRSENASAGAAWLQVDRSTTPYPQAPVSLIENGRDGLRTWTAFARHAPGGGQAAGFSAWGEVALQRNGRIGMTAWGGVADVGWRWGHARWRPRLSWSPRVFSGDDPGTPARLERFDPLFYDGSPATWASGGNGSFAFYNSNLRVQRLRVDLAFGPRDFANVSVYDVRADRRDSPVQYGQAARLSVVDGSVALVSGFPDRRLTRELYVEHTHVFDAHRFLTWGIAVAQPRQGIRAVVPGADTWVGGLVNLTVRY